MPKDLTTLANELNEFARAQEEFGGQTITVYPGDVTLDSGGSLTDANGDVFTLQHMGGDFANSGQLADVYKNGTMLGSGQTLGGGFWVDLRLVDGVVLAENGKGIGWFGPDRAGAPDPGPGDNAGVSDDTPVVVADDTPVATDDETPPATDDETTAATDDETTASDDETPPASDDDTTTATDDETTTTDTAENPPASTSDDTVVNLCDTEHQNRSYEHKIQFVRKVAADTTQSDNATASTTTSTVNRAVLADLCTSAVADITAARTAAVTQISKIVSAAVCDDVTVPQHSAAVDQSAASLRQTFAQCFQQPAETAAG